MNATTPHRRRIQPVAVPRDAEEIVDLLVDEVTRVLLVGRSHTEALDLFGIVVDAARVRENEHRGDVPVELVIRNIVRANGVERLQMFTGSSLKIASAAAPRGLDSHHYDVVLLAPNVVLDEVLARNLAAAVAPARGGAGVIAWLPAVA